MKINLTLDKLKVDGEQYKPNGLEFDCTSVQVQIDIPDEFVIESNDYVVTVIPEGAYYIAKTLREAQNKIFNPNTPINPNEFSSIFGDEK